MVPACKNQGGSNTRPAPCSPIPFSPVISVITTALFAGERGQLIPLQSMPTALFGDSPSHGRSHERACTQRHGHVIPLGQCCFLVAVWAGRRKQQIPAGRHHSAPSPMPIRARGRGNHLSSSFKKIQMICSTQ